MDKEKYLIGYDPGYKDHDSGLCIMKTNNNGVVTVIFVEHGKKADVLFNILEELCKGALVQIAKDGDK